MTININNASDCAVEILILMETLRRDRRYVNRVYSKREVVEIAVQELYDKMVYGGLFKNEDRK